MGLGPNVCLGIIGNTGAGRIGSAGGTIGGATVGGAAVAGTEGNTMKGTGTGAGAITGEFSVSTTSVRGSGPGTAAATLPSAKTM